MDVNDGGNGAGKGNGRVLASAFRSRAVRFPGVTSARRPVTPGADERFDLFYIRANPGDGTPVLVLPGGPGLASLAPYGGFRRDATNRGLDVIMVEHRGVGLSRHTDAGTDLPPEAITVSQVLDDLAAVLDHCGATRAVVYGSSYGAFLAQMFGARYPERVAGMVLDSGGSLDPDEGLIVREELRGLLWSGRNPRTAAVARKLRELAGDGLIPARESGAVIPPIYEFGGVGLLDRFYDQLREGRADRTWRWMAELGKREVGKGEPMVMEPDLVRTLTFRELERRPEPDGLPLDPLLVHLDEWDDRWGEMPQFEGWPHDPRAAMPSFDWPCAVISGERDVRAPRLIARQLVDLLPDAVLVPLADTGHSALDTHRLAALHVTNAVLAGTHARLPSLAERIARLPRRGSSGRLGGLIAARLAAERLLPNARRALVR